MNDESPHPGSLLAGAGRAEIALPPSLFPTEGLVGVHDTLSVRALLLESDRKAAFISVELTSLPDEQIVALYKIVAELAGVPPENAWVCVTHTFSAPHVVPERYCDSPGSRQKNALLVGAVEEATRGAVSQAVASMRRARFGSGTGLCDVNVNRDVPTAEGWWLGFNELGPSDKSVVVLRVETLEADPIALLFNYAVQSSVMDEPPATGDRLVSADLAGAASRFVERQYGGTVPVIFCMGAAGDQAPALKGARFQYVGKDGHLVVEDVDDRGFVIAEMLGARLGAEVLRVSEATECRDFDGSLVVRTDAFSCSGQVADTDPHGARPATEHVFVPADEREQTVHTMGLGGLALVGVSPELSAYSGMCMKEKSPFHHTMVLTMVNGGAKYMPDAGAYDRVTYEATHSPFARGSAELLCERVVGLLHDAKGLCSDSLGSGFAL